MSISVTLSVNGVERMEMLSVPRDADMRWLAHTVKEIAGVPEHLQRVSVVDLNERTVIKEQRLVDYINSASPQNLQAAGLRSRMTVRVLPENARFQASPSLASQEQFLKQLSSPAVREFFNYINVNFLRTEYQRRNEYKRLMMPNGPYGIRGDCSLFEHPGRLSSNFVDCRITLGDRYLIRSYIEAYYHCDDNEHIDDILMSDGFDPEIIRLLQHKTPEQIRIETIQNVM